MKKTILILLTLVTLILTTTKINAQTTQTLAWDFAVVPSVTATYTQTVTIDGTIQTAVPTCVAKGTTATTCSIPITALTSGTHSISIAALLSGITATTIVNGLNPNNAPKNAINITISINQIINVP